MLLWVELCLKDIVQVLTPVPVNVTLFGYRVFTDVIKLGWSYWIWVSLKPLPSVLI